MTNGGEGQSEVGATSRGQTEVISSVLMIGVLVVALSVGGGAVLVSYAGQMSDSPPPVGCQVTQDDGVVVTHEGGDDVALSKLNVVFRNDSGTTRQSFPADVGDGDDTFEPGERAVLGSVDGETTVVVTFASRHVLCEDTLGPTTTTGSGSETPPSDGSTTTTEPSTGSAPVIENVSATHWVPGNGNSKVYVTANVSDEDGDLESAVVTVWKSDERKTKISEATLILEGDTAEIYEKFTAIKEGEAPYYVNLTVTDDAGHTTTWTGETEADPQNDCNGNSCQAGELVERRDESDDERRVTPTTLSLY